VPVPLSTEAAGLSHHEISNDADGSPAGEFEKAELSGRPKRTEEKKPGL
jgi:hypothetical protein